MDMDMALAMVMDMVTMDMPMARHLPLLRLDLPMYMDTATIRQKTINILLHPS